MKFFTLIYVFHSLLKQFYNLCLIYYFKIIYVISFGEVSMTSHISLHHIFNLVNIVL